MNDAGWDRLIQCMASEIERLRAEVRVLTNTPRPSQPDAAGVAWAHELFAMGSSNLCSLRLKENSDA